MKVDLEKLEAAVSSAQSALWGEIVEREFLMRQAWPRVLAELRAAREVVRVADDLCHHIILCRSETIWSTEEELLIEEMEKYKETVK